jgi:2-iminoacetate synthase ThiH
MLYGHTTKMEKTEQIMEHLLAKIRALQEKMVSHQKEIMADMRAWQKEMEPYPDKMEANPEEMMSVGVHEEVAEEEANIVYTKSKEALYFYE